MSPMTPTIVANDCAVDQLSVTVQATKEGTFTVKGVSFRYNRNLASTESLSRRGDRLYATKAQLLEPTYAEDSSLKIAVKPPQPILQVVGEDAVLELYAGETRNLALTLINAGSQSLRDLRVLCDAHHIAVDATGGTDAFADAFPVFWSDSFTQI